MKRAKQYFRDLFASGYKLKATDLDDMVDSYQDELPAEELTKLSALPDNIDTRLTTAETKLATVGANTETRLTNAETKLISDKGYYATTAALLAAHPTATDGAYARNGETDTIWMWDSGAWKNTDNLGSGATPIASEAEEIAGLVTTKVSTPGGRSSWWTNLKTLAQTIAGRWYFSSGIESTYYDFDDITPPASPAANVGRLYAVNESGLTTLEYKSPSGFVIRAFRDSPIVVRNTSGAAITKGRIVYVTGVTGNDVPTVSLAQADSVAKLAGVLVAAQDMDNNAFGRCFFLGKITGVNTSGMSSGQLLYVSQTTAGAFTNVEPTTGLKLEIGTVLSASNNGAITVKIGQVSNLSTLTTKQDSLGWLNVKRVFGAKEDGRYLYDVAVTGTAVTSARATFTVADVGKVIKINTAGTAGRDHTTTIASVQSATACTLTVAAPTARTGMFAVYGTDDTAAIQAGINFLATQPWLTLFFPIDNRGIYVLNGALNQTLAASYPNSQLYLPVYGDVNSNQSLEVLPSLKLQGQVLPGPNIPYSQTAPVNRPVQQSGVVLHSTLTTGSTYTDAGTVNGQTFSDVIPPAVIGGRNRGLGYYTLHTRMSFYMQDMAVVVASNNALTGGTFMSGINGRQIDCLGIKSVRVTSDTYGRDLIDQTLESSAIIFPDYSTDNQRDNSELFVSGFKYGIVYGEHGTYSSMWALNCKYGHVFTKSLHPIFVTKGASHYCTYPIAVASSALLAARAGQVSFDITNFAVEQYTEATVTTWRKHVVTILDSDSWGNAKIRGQAYNISNSPAVLVPFSKTGGSNIRISNMSHYKYESNAAAVLAGMAVGSEYVTSTGERRYVVSQAVTSYAQNFDGTSNTAITALSPQTGTGNFVMFTGDPAWLADGTGAVTSQHAGTNNRTSVGSQQANNIRITLQSAITLSGSQNFSLHIGRSSHDATTDPTTGYIIGVLLQVVSSNYVMTLTETIGGVNQGTNVLSTPVAPFANPVIAATLINNTLTARLLNGVTEVANAAKTMVQINSRGIHGFTANYAGCKISQFTIESL